MTNKTSESQPRSIKTICGAGKKDREGRV